MPSRLATAVLLGILAPALASADTDWDGSSDTDWFNGANWTDGVPSNSDDVIIQASATNFPVLDASGAICRSLTIENGATLDLDTFSLDCSGDLDCQDTDVLLSSATGRVTFTDDTTVLSPFTFDGDIWLNGSGKTLTFAADVTFNDLRVELGTMALSDGTARSLTITGNVTVDAAHTLDRALGTVDIAGSVTINGTYDDSDATGGTTVAGNWTDSGTFQIGTQTVTFDGGGTSTVSVPDSSDFYSLTITNSTTVNVTTDIDINGTVTVNSGSVLDVDGDLDVTGGNTTISGTGRLQIGDTVTSLGTFTAGSGTVEYDSTAINQTIENVTYHDLEIDVGTRTASPASNITVGGDLLGTSGTIAAGTHTVTVAGTTDVDGGLVLNSGTIDANGSFDATGGTVNLSSGRLELGGAVTSLGTLFESSGTVAYDDSTTNRTVIAETYFDLEIDNGTRVALTGGNVTVTDDLTVTSGELEVDDADTLRVDDDVTVSGTLDLEPGSTLLLAAATVMTVSGTFEAQGTETALALVSSSDTGTPGRYTFAVSAGGVIDANHIYFQYMDASGIQITDNGSVSALTQLDHAYFDNGATGGVLLDITNNDNAATLDYVFLADTNGDLAYSVQTSSATAAITLDHYGSGFGSTYAGPDSENDNGGGRVDPGLIIWNTYTPATLREFTATVEPGGVRLEWETISEWRTLGFALERTDSGSPPFSRIGPAVIAATGLSPGGSRYAFLDGSARRGIPYRYRLLEVDIQGLESTLASVTAMPLSPTGAPRSSRRRGRRSAAAPPVAAAATAPSATLPGFTPAPVNGNRVRILTEASGITRVTHDALAAAGFPVVADPDRFILRRDGVAHPTRVVGGEDGTFDPGDAIDFFALPFHHLESPHDVYVLEVAGPGVLPPRIASVSGAPRGTPLPLGFSRTETVVEEDFLYVLSLTSGEGRDHWFGGILPAPGSLEVPFEVDALAPGGVPTVEVTLEGWTEDLLDPLDHLTRVLLNGVDLGELAGYGPGPYGGELEIPLGLLVEGQNLLRLEGIDLGHPGVSYLDRVGVRHLRFDRAIGDRVEFSANGFGTVHLEGFSGDAVELYRIPEDGAPLHITDAGVSPSPSGIGFDLGFSPAVAERTRHVAFVASAARSPVAVEPTVVPLGDPADGADLVIIAPIGLAAEVEPLAVFHRSRGLRVAVVPLEEVFDRFGGGRPTTDAIRAFLRHAWNGWGGNPISSVLLVGDATYDPRGNLGPSPRQVLPTRLVETGSMQTASDLWFADLVGDDSVPELAIGRFPVATAKRCRAVVRKTIDAMTAPSRPARITLVRDDEGDFAGMSEGVAAMLPNSVETVLLDLASLGRDELRDVLLPKEWPASDVVHYSGHGSRLQWSADEILHADDVPELPRRTRTPVVTAMNCLNGFFHLPGSPSLGEALVLQPEGGAVAYFGPSAVTTHIRQQRLAESLFRRLHDGTDPSLGEAIRGAITDLADDPETADIRKTWILLGDPELRFP